MCQGSTGTASSFSSSMPGSETFSPFLNADVLKKCEAERVVVKLLVLETRGNLVEDNVCNDALHVTWLYGPGDKVLFFF